MQFRSELHPSCHLCVHIARSLAAPSIGHVRSTCPICGHIGREEEVEEEEQQQEAEQEEEAEEEEEDGAGGGG